MIPQVFVHKSRHEDGKFFVAREVYSRAGRSCASNYKRLSKDVSYKAAWEIAHAKIEEANKLLAGLVA